jgi:hypothetical protein
VAGRQQDTTGSFPYPNDVAGCGCAEDAILTDQQLLDTVGGTNLGDQLSDLWVPVTPVTANDENRAVNTLRDGLENAGDEGFRVVVLLEDPDLLTQTRTVEEQISTVRAGELRDGMVELQWVPRLPQVELWGEKRVTTTTYVPGFWSWKGLSSTVRTLMICYVLQAVMGAIEAIEVFAKWVQRLSSTFELERGTARLLPTMWDDAFSARLAHSRQEVRHALLSPQPFFLNIGRMRHTRGDFANILRLSYRQRPGVVSR